MWRVLLLVGGACIHSIAGSFNCGLDSLPLEYNIKKNLGPAKVAGGVYKTKFIDGRIYPDIARSSKSFYQPDIANLGIQKPAAYLPGGIVHPYILQGKGRVEVVIHKPEIEGGLVSIYNYGPGSLSKLQAYPHQQALQILKPGPVKLPNAIPGNAYSKSYSSIVQPVSNLLGRFGEVPLGVYAQSGDFGVNLENFGPQRNSVILQRAVSSGVGPLNSIPAYKSVPAIATHIGVPGLGYDRNVIPTEQNRLSILAPGPRAPLCPYPCLPPPLSCLPPPPPPPCLGLY